MVNIDSDISGLTSFTQRVTLHLIKRHSYIDNFRSAIFLAGDYKIDLWKKFFKVARCYFYKDWKDLNEIK